LARLKDGSSAWNEHGTSRIATNQSTSINTSPQARSVRKEGTSAAKAGTHNVANIIWTATTG
jgi:hypothetical protein